ncbi:ribonuclease domain-containing protein [Oscillospiraceae bacterium 38-13]
MKRWLSGLLAALTLFSLTSCGLPAAAPAETPGNACQEELVDLPVHEDASPELPESPAAPEPEPQETEPQESEPAALPENGTYTTKEDVALYIHTYDRLPDNFITKKEAQDLGWPGGDLEPYAPGMCIGGNRFGNYEGLLPEAEGRTYTECDIDTLGAGSRGAKRIVFSNDGLIYYTEDHYASFELLYGDRE